MKLVYLGNKSVLQAILISLACLLLLPAFFILHHYSFSYPWLPLQDGIEMIFTYFLAGLILMASFSWLMKDLLKGTISAALVIGFQLSFGIISTRLHLAKLLSWAAIPLGLLLLFGAIFLIYRTQKNVYGLLKLLTVTLLALFSYEFYEFVTKKNIINRAMEDRPVFKTVDTISRPNIFMIVMDGYPGEALLSSEFNFDNSKFYSELSRRGFQVLSNTKSNYDYTWCSMASMLNLQYLPADYKHPRTLQTISILKIRDATLWDFLKNQEYTVINWSQFPAAGSPPLERLTGRLYERASQHKIFNDRTFLRILEQYLPSRYQPLKPKTDSATLKFNKKVLNNLLTWKSSGKSNFVYGHLIMPHFPHYVNEKGLPVEEKKWLSKSTYLPYLEFTNQKILEVVDSIHNEDPKAVISLISDHGAREYDAKFHFTSFNAVYFHDRDYTSWYDGVTNVNHFRIFMNKLFNQNFQMLKDSTAPILYR